MRGLYDIQCLRRCIKLLSHTFRGREVNDITIRLEHVDLLDGLDWLHVHLLQRRLQLLVVRARALVDLLDLSPWCALSSVLLTSAVLIICMAIRLLSVA